MCHHVGLAAATVVEPPSFITSVFQHPAQAMHATVVGVVVQCINKEGADEDEVEEDEGKEHLLWHSDQVIHAAVLKGRE
jgi:hypothetical protein